MTSATVLADPLTPITVRAAEITRLRDRGRVQVGVVLERIDRDIAHRRAQLSALGPAATLARGYAVVQAGTRVVRTIQDAPAGTELRIRVADGAVLAVSSGTEQAE